MTEFQVGDIIRTKAGKVDAVITSIQLADTPESAAAKLAVIAERGYGSAPDYRDRVWYVSLRDGKQFGPIRTSLLENIRKVR